MMEKGKTTEKKKNVRELLDKKIKSITGAIAGVRDKIKERISAYVKKADTAGDMSKLKEYSYCAVYTVFGFLMSVTTLPQSIKPLGISAVCAASGKNAVLFTYIGAALGCITYGRDALSSFIIYFMLYAVRKTFTDSAFSEKLNVKMLEAAGASAVVGIIRICTAVVCLHCSIIYIFFRGAF